MVTDEGSPAQSLFVGRERERAVIALALAALPAHRGGLVLIAGEAGVGKTALATEMAQRATAQGARVLIGRCFESVPTAPYGVWLDLFGHYDSATFAVPPPSPFAGHTLTGIPDPAGLTAQLRDWLRALAARGPLVLILEDLHWADPASLDLLRMLARALQAIPALVLATYREDALDRGHPLYQILPQIARESAVTTVTLFPLRDAEIRALVDGRYALPPPDATRLAAYLSARADGNAFFTVELLRALEEHGALRRASVGWRLGDLGSIPTPALLRQMVDARTARLGSDAHILLEVAAAIGEEVPFALWAKASERDERTVLAFAERAIAAHLLTLAADDAVRFVHALTRDALLAGMPLLRRRQVHRRIADALLAQAHADPGIVASHLRAAGDDRALAWFLRAAARAEAASAFKSAATYLEATLPLLVDEPDGNTRRAATLLRIAALMRHAPWTIPHAREALQIARDIGDAPLAAIATMGLGFATMLVMIEYGDELAAQRDALAVLEGLSPPALAGLIGADSGTVSLAGSRQFHAEFVATTGDRAEVFRLLDAAETRPYSHRAFEDGCAYIALGITYTGIGRTREARAAFADAVAWFNRFEQFGSAGSVCEWELNELTLVCETDDLTRREVLAARAEGHYAEDPATAEMFPAGYARAGLLALEGAWDAALAALREGRERMGILGWVGYHAHTIAHLCAARGETDQAWAMVRTVFPDGPYAEPGGRYLQNAQRMQRLAARLALEDNDLTTGRAWLETHDRWLAWSGAVLGQAEGANAWGIYHRAVADPTRAWAAAERSLALATAPRQPLALLAAHRLLGELATEAGRWDEAAAHLDAAAALADACAAPYECALTLIARADLAAWRGDAPGAAESLAQARALCGPLGATVALRRADAIAERIATADPRPDAPRRAPPPQGLTEREIGVLRLLAQGRSNRQIAATLGITARTVERHISNIYNRIGAGNRAEATAFAIQYGVLEAATDIPEV